MPGILDFFRRGHRQAIRENAVTITVTRRERVSENGAFAETTSELGPFTVRIHQVGAVRPREVKSLAGTAELAPRWAMLADETADLRAGPQVVDEFTVPALGRFRVVGVMPLTVNGEVYGYQADLEQVM